MKKVLAVIVVSFMLATSCFASVTVTSTLSSAQAVAQNTTVYSNKISVDDLAGHVAIRIISTAGSVTITQQCSLDGVTFYDPVDTAGTALGQVVAAQTVTTGIYVVPDVVLAPFIRYKIVEGNVAASAVTINLVSLRS